MPYGGVIVCTLWQADYFIKNHCKECWKNNPSSPCSVEDKGKCDEMVQNVREYRQTLVDSGEYDKGINHF